LKLVDILGCLIMNFRNLPLIKLLVGLRWVVILMMCGWGLWVAIFASEYGRGQTGRGVSVIVGIEVGDGEMISPSDCGGLFSGEWEYVKVKSDALTELLREGQPAASDGVDKGDADDGEDREVAGGQRVFIRRSYDSESQRWRCFLDGKRHELMGLDGEGNLVLYETIDESHDARTVYEPALILIYADQEKGRVYRQKTNATVWSVKRPKRKDDHGSVKSEVVYEGDDEITTTASGFATAHRIHTVQHMDFKRADVDIDSTTWYVDGFGQVGTIDREKIRAFGLIGWEDNTGLLLVGLHRGLSGGTESWN